MGRSVRRAGKGSAKNGVDRVNTVFVGAARHAVSLCDVWKGTTAALLEHYNAARGRCAILC